MKVYLVSEVVAYSDEPMVKRFEAFTTEKDAKYTFISTLLLLFFLYIQL